MDPKRKLKGMLARIFSDGEVSDEERDELKSYLAPGAFMMPSDVRDVLADFVATTWKITIADGVVSDAEKRRLRTIVAELEIDRALLPPEWQALVE